MLLLLVATACGDDAGGAGAAAAQRPECESGNQPPQGLLCVDGKFVACESVPFEMRRRSCRVCGCPADYTCDQNSSRCLGTTPIGEACEMDDDCGSRNCIGAGPKRCGVGLGEACTVDDCDVCLASNDGMSYCSRRCPGGTPCGEGQVCDGKRCVPDCCDRFYAGGDCPRKACPTGFRDHIFYEPVQQSNGGWAATPFCTCELEEGFFHVLGAVEAGGAGGRGAAGSAGRAGTGGASAGAPRYTFINTDNGQSCAIRDDDSLVCWGSPLLDSFMQQPLTMYDRHGDMMCGVRPDGQALCESVHPDADPYGLLDVPSGSFRELSVQASFVCGLQTDGALTCWGSGVGAAPAGEFTALATGSDSGCALRREGSIDCWGDVSALGPLPSGVDFLAIDGDLRTYCAVRADGSVLCWGQDPLEPPDGVAFRSIRVNSDTACGITSDGSIACFGLTVTGEDPPPGAFTSLSISPSHGCGLDFEGQAQCWYLTSNHSGPVMRAVVDTPLP